MKSNIEKTILLSDIHFDSADEEKVALIERFAKAQKPDVIFLNGDIIDMYATSKHGKHPKRYSSLKQDIDRTVLFLQKLRKDHPNAQIHYVCGNHEARLDAYIVENAPELFDYVNLEKILGLKDLKIKFYISDYRENWFKYRNLYVGHYNKVASEAGYTASLLMRQKGVSLIQGHVHRVGMTAKTYLDRTDFAYENPCLADFDNGYVSNPNWQSGCSVIYFNKGNNQHWWYPVVIKEGRFIFDGKEWKV